MFDAGTHHFDAATSTQSRFDAATSTPDHFDAATLTLSKKFFLIFLRQKWRRQNDLLPFDVSLYLILYHDFKRK